MKKTWVFLSLAVLISVGRKWEGAPSRVVLFCYYSRWAWFRDRWKVDVALSPWQVPETLCTHFVYSFAKVTDNMSQPYAYADIAGFEQFNNVKKRNPEVKTLLAVGNFFSTTAEDITFENMLRFKESRATFVKSAVALARSAGFDFIDVDWTAVPFEGKALKNYHDVYNISLLIQFTTVKEWLQSNVPPSKLLVGLPFYGRSFTLVTAWEHEIGSEAYGDGYVKGLYNMPDGQLAFSQLCVMFNVRHSLPMESAFTQEFDYTTKTPYAFSGNQWISYDHVDSIVFKLNWLKQNNLGGATVWSVDKDDITGDACGFGPFPLLRTVHYCLLTYRNCTAGATGFVIDKVIVNTGASSGASCPYSTTAVGIALFVITVIFNSLETLP